MTFDCIFKWVLSVLLGFMSGGIMFCRVIPKIIKHKDIESISDDGNPGAANVFKNFGKKLGLICLALDILKGFLPVFFMCNEKNVHIIWFTAVMAAPVLGHAIAPYTKKRGGKCIAVSFGVLLALLPITYAVLLLAVIYIVTSTVIKINPIRIRSITVYTLFCIISCSWLIFRGLFPVALGCIIISIVVILKHLPLFHHETVKDKVDPNDRKKKILN